MAVNIPAPTAVTGTAKLVATVPSGVCTVILSNTGGANVIYIGESAGVTATSGFPLPVNATVTFSGYPGSSGTPLWAIAGGTGNNLGIIISTAQ